VGLRPGGHGDGQLRDRGRRAGAGATLATGVPVAAVARDEGVVLEDGTTIHATTVVCNADPKVVLRLLEDHAPPSSGNASTTGSCEARW
jgi:phytoene dehydrogenase-like protein